jgi:hypothetical protein
VQAGRRRAQADLVALVGYTPEQVADLFIERYGPTNRAFSSLR